MLYLLIVSFIWAFSFGLIKSSLTGLDPNIVSFIRLFISLIIFLPFLKIKILNIRFSVKLILIGAIQYGIMYSTYIYSYQFLKAYEVALFTIFTPIYVTFINDLFNKKINKIFFASAFIAVLGAFIIAYHNLESLSFIKGILILQISNLCFAFGQVYYKKVMKSVSSIKDHQIFGLLYLGGVIITGIFSLFTGNYHNFILSNNQWLILIYLGLIASGLGFFLWNYGVRKANIGTVAVFNNLKVPLAISVSILFFNEHSNILRLIIGGVIVIFALFFNEYFVKMRRVHSNLDV